MGKRGYVLLMAGLAVMLCACTGKSAALEGNQTVPVFAETPSEPSPAVTFPCALGDGLTAESITAYDGPFWEDGSGEAVSGVAALMLCNTGQRMIEFGSVTVEQGGRTLHFFVYDLPPGSRCLVMEWQRQPFSQEAVRACHAGVLRWSHQELSREEVDYLGTDEKLTVVNRTARRKNITVRYKRYDKEGDHFLGGMAFSAYFFAVEPKNPKTLAPAHYHAGEAKVVSVTIGE